MLVLVTYDVSTESAAGRKRLTHVAKKCTAYGQRVQNSVFECVLDATQLRKLQGELERLIDPREDSLRFYNLGNRYKERVTHIGIKPSLEMDAPLIV
ncbi:MAG: CRISPR-associated endonuclease Cas2 [Oscillospiraceae bacterium]|jgi:CRISPR-associated protein Cas2|nr:CRISPR-associated endonuclease Cas2 [Oscillospiraceae bacterium]